MDRSFKKLLAFAAVAVASAVITSSVARGEGDAAAPTKVSAAAAPAVDIPCGTEGCDAACDPQSCCGRHLIVGAEAVWLAPLNNQRLASFDIINLDTDATTSHCGSENVCKDGMVASPRITLGLQNDCGWGVQVRYWRLDECHDVNASDQLLGTGSFAQSNFMGETLDLELTRLVDFCDSLVQLTFGVRYAQLQQSAGVNANQIINGEFYSGSVLSNVGFSGAGITSSVSGLRPIGCSNFNIFYSFRASVMWDNCASNSVQTWADFESPVNGWAKAYDGAFAGSDGTLFIGEVQLGGQWNYALKCIPANAFLRVAFEYQYWAATNMGCTSALSAASGPALAGVASGRSGEAFVDLVGFNIGTGITW